MSKSDKNILDEIKDLRGQADQTQKELELVKQRQDEVERRIEALTLELKVQLRDF